MKKDRLSQILNVLLLPYTDVELCKNEKDAIENLRYSFAKLRDRQGLSQTEKRKTEKEYYRSEHDMTTFLQQHTELQAHDLDDLKMLINLFYPEDKIADLYNSFGKKGIATSHNIERYYLYNLFRIADSLLTFRDGEIAIRAWMNEEIDGECDIFAYSDIFDKVEIWNLLCRKMVPDVFIAAFYVEAGLIEPRYLYGQTGSIMLADKTLERILQKGIAETHLHLNAGLQFEILWEYATTLSYWEKYIHSEEAYQKRMEDDMAVGLHIAVFRLVLAEYLEEISEKEDNVIGFDAYVKEVITKTLFADLYKGNVPKYNEEWQGYIERVMSHYGISFLEQQSDLLMETVYKKYSNYGTYSEMILILKCINYLKHNKFDVFLLHMFFQYIRIKNEYYKKVVKGEQIRGLDNFQTYYGRMTRTFVKNIPDTNKRLEYIFKNLSHNIHLRKLEIRISPPEVVEANLQTPLSGKKDLKNKILESVKCTLAEYRKYIWRTNSSSVTEHKFPTVGIIFHFLKRDYVDNRIPDMCWYVWNEKKEIDSKHILKWREKMVVCAKAIEELRSEIPLLSEYVVGIDAASVENNAEPWIFAPIYAAIRNRTITKPLLYDKNMAVKINNIGFTYHVGEEFRHVLSGLRHVDEVIRFFHYKAGDRIGHAIVLGIDVDRWTKENEVVVMPIMEYLEDLLWLWGKIVHEENVFSVSVDVVEGRILELAKQIYGEILGITPNMLYDAYLEKFKLDNSDIFMKMKNIIDGKGEHENRKGEFRNEHFCRYYNKISCYGVIWTKEKLLCANFCPIYYQRMQHPTLVHVNGEMNLVLKEAQNKVVQLVEEKGIYVETNPTSNLAIGEIDSLEDSHLFRLNSRHVKEGNNKHEVLVTINSDDPMIFSTNSENELAYVYHAMNYKGYGKESVLEWIDKIRQYGIDSSFIKKEKSVQEQLKEIDYLLEKIEMYEKRNN